MDKKPVGMEYSGPSGIGRDSMWLTNEDLIEGKDFPVEIESVLLYKKVEFLEGRERTNVLALKFKDRERQLLVNGTIRKCLNAMFGSVTKNWTGNTVRLYVTDVMSFGQMVKCVRIRNEKSRAATAAEELLSGDEPGATGTDAK